jgi:hypothetical protein
MKKHILDRFPDSIEKLSTRSLDQKAALKSIIVAATVRGPKCVAC